MRAYKMTHLSDRELLRELMALVVQDRATTAAVLAHIAEVDARRLYAAAGYDSMYVYCVQALHLSEDSAYKRIQAARTARKFPAIYAALAAGKLHLSAVVLLAPHLITENADDLLAAAAGKSKSEIELLLARRFPRTELMPMVCAQPMPRRQEQLAPGQVEERTPPVQGGQTHELAPGQVVAPAPQSKVAPVAHERFALQVTIDQSTHDKLRYAQSLLSHQLPNGEIAEVLDRALDLLIGKLEKQKFAATEQPRTNSKRRAAAKRTIPAHVKRAVWNRDRGQCTFVGETGRQCSARTLLEYDHVNPVARGGQATVQGVRLLCWAHNQYEAERAFGSGFMDDKREAARCEKERRQASESDRDVMSALQTLGYRAGEARRAAAFSEPLAGASLEERVRFALSYFRPRARSCGRAVTSAASNPRIPPPTSAANAETITVRTVPVPAGAAPLNGP